MKMNTNPVRGTYDYLPKQAELREEVRQIILKSYKENGFSLINTPILENLDLLNSSDGGDNLRLMFKTIKRGDKLDLTKPNLTENDITEEGLRYDLTVPLARFYANNREKLPCPFKAIQIDYSFRAERPQRGRDRQFIQCDIDEFGDDSIGAEIDVLTTGVSCYLKLGFDNLKVKVNSRQILNSLVLNAGIKQKDIVTTCVSLDKLDKIYVDGVEKELNEKFEGVYPNEVIHRLMLSIDDVKNNGAKVLSNYGVALDDITRVEALVSAINKLFKANQCEDKFKCIFDVSIVRGQGYYTGVVYEVYTEGFCGAIGAGGRYDKMINKLIGIDVPAVGFSIGFAPVCMLLEEKNAQFDKKNKIALFYENENIEEVLGLKQKLLNNYNVSIYKKPKNLKALLDKLGFVGFSGFAYYRNDVRDIEVKSI